MKFQFEVKMTDQDYLDFNTFIAIRSHYGKKQMLTFRLTIVIIFAVVIFASLFGGNFSVNAFIGVIPMVIVLLLVEIFFDKIFTISLRSTVKSFTKKGKKAYSPCSTLSFYEDYMSDSCEDNKIEHKYTAIERISIVDSKMIYIHVSSVMSYILPIACFESEEQYDSFIRFIETKCAIIDIY